MKENGAPTGGETSREMSCAGQPARERETREGRRSGLAENRTRRWVPWLRRLRRLLHPVGERGRTEVGPCEYSEYPYRLLYPVGERGCAARTSLFGLVGDHYQSHGRGTGPLRTAHYSLVAQRPVARREGADGSGPV